MVYVCIYICITHMLIFVNRNYTESVARLRPEVRTMTTCQCWHLPHEIRLHNLKSSPNCKTVVLELHLPTTLQLN